MADSKRGNSRNKKRPSRAWGALGVFLAFALASVNAFAYVRSLGMSGGTLYWAGAHIPFNANPSNSSGLTPAQVSTAFQDSIAAWTAQGMSILPSYAQSNAVAPQSGHDGSNTIYFASAGGVNIGFNVIAVTEVTYYTSNGQIAGADMIYNDLDFLFTTTAGDTGQTDAGTGLMKVFLADVATHEFGHAWGFDHSTVNRSSLVFTAFSGQFNPGRDDRSAVRSAYPPAGSVAASGSITGTVVGQNGGIFGAQVSAVDLLTGRVEAATLAATDGSFRIGDIPPGTYGVMVEPLYAPSSTISTYYGNVDHRFCSGSRFKRGFYANCGANGVAATLAVTAGSATDAGVLAPSCSAMANAGAAPTTLALARALPAGGGAAFGDLAAGGTRYWKITLAAGGTLSARAQSYTLFSPLDVEVRILDSSGNPVAGATTVDDVEAPMPGGYTNYDASAEALGLAPGTYYLEVRAKAGLVASSRFPAGSYLVDSAGFYLVSAAVDGAIAASGAVSMSACANVVNTLQTGLVFASRERRSGSSTTNGGGCGTVTDGSGSGGGGGPGVVNLIVVLGAAFLAQVAARLARLARGTHS